jgi:hypothetical protein
LQVILAQIPRQQEDKDCQWHKELDIRKNLTARALIRINVPSKCVWNAQVDQP